MSDEPAGGFSTYGCERCSWTIEASWERACEEYRQHWAAEHAS